MSKTQSEQNDRRKRWRKPLFAGLLILFGGLSVVALLTLKPSDLNSLQLQAGNVAPVDILAPLAISYKSESLTAQQREAAAQAIPPVYTTLDTQIARQQVDKLRSALTYISATRADTFASLEQKMADLAILENSALDVQTAEAILALDDEQWQAVQQESILVLQQVMRSTIREGQLEDAERSLPALVSLSLPEEQASLVAALVRIFITPNSFYSEELTEARRLKAQEEVAPVSRSFVQGETVVQRGKVLTAADLEAMQQLGLLHAEDEWLNALNVITIVLLSTSFTVLYLHLQTGLLLDLRRFAFIIFTFLAFLYIARITLPNHIVIPYVFPVAGFSLLMAALFGAQPGMVLGIPLSLLITHGMPDGLELTIFYVMSSMFGVLLLGKGWRLTSYLWAGLAVGGIGATAIVIYRMLDPFTDTVGLLTLIGVALVNGIVSTGITVLIQLVAAQPLGMTTALQLMELSRPDRPLLRFILQKSPGTYQHSLQVANLAEQAAERIGADALLTRVGALYHDAGKALNPQYFIENQVPGSPNIHNSLSPEDSAAIIIGHVTEGLELAKKHRLPTRIQDFVVEHHGNALTRYQYINAVKAKDGDKSLVDESAFRYPGPRPRSRETALVMLADSCEARARAERPGTAEALRIMVKDTLDKRFASDQLDDTELTARDLNTIVNSFTATLRGIYHPRIKYPTLDQRTVPSPRREKEKPPQPEEQPPAQKQT